MRIQHNIPAMSAYRNYTNNVSAMKKNLEKLSSGYRINRAGDDAAGLAISEKMRAQITGLETAQKNAKDGISLVQTAEGALTEVHDMLNRMVTLATQSANGTYDNETDRFQLQKELDQLRSEIDRIADSSNFNGIKLLDGSLDTAGSTNGIKDSSAIQNIQTTDYAAAGSSPAFEATFVTNRPEAANTQTNAEFQVDLDDISIAGLVSTGDTFVLKVGDATITYQVQNGDAVTDAASLAAKLINCGYASAGNVTACTNGATGGAATGLDTTASWNDKVGGTTPSSTGASATNNHIKIDGHWYKMTAVAGVSGDCSIKFEQVDFMGNNGETVDPNYEVSINYNQASANANLDATKGTAMNGTVNDHVQKPIMGQGIGSSHQAQVDVSIDFSQLKDGDKLTVGDTTYVFQIGSESTAPTLGTGEKLIDLHTLLKEDADMADEAKLQQAMTKIVEGINGGTNNNTTWTAGNFGIDGTMGKISFQSKSTYTDDSKVIGTGANATAATDPTQKANMTTEAKVMAQFYSKRGLEAASTSFDIDVTKIKQGDSFTVNGVKFEFYSGTGNMKDDTATKIDLTSLGDIENGSLLSSQTADVLNLVNTAVSNALGANYTVTNSGSTLTITSKDNASTGVDERKVAATVELPKESRGGKELMLQIGDTADDFNQLKVSIGDCHVAAIGVKDISIADQESAVKAVDAIKSAINYVSDVRGTLGATQNRLDHTINNLSVMTENIQDAESTIRDTDVAAEMMEYTKNNILIQSAQAMLAQANQMPQGVLQLLQ